MFSKSKWHTALRYSWGTFWNWSLWGSWANHAKIFISSTLVHPASLCMDGKPLNRKCDEYFCWQRTSWSTVWSSDYWTQQQRVCVESAQWKHAFKNNGFKEHFLHSATEAETAESLQLCIKYVKMEVVEEVFRFFIQEK